MTPCERCHDPSPFSKKYIWENGESVLQGCDRCLGVTSTIYDVYFRHPYKSEALDVEFTSQAQKGRYLREHGISEAGDRPLGQKSWLDGTRAHRRAQFEKDRPMIRETYRRYLQHARSK